MIFTLFSVFNVLIAAAMIVLILMQRGAGADAGSSFGGGASGTVFGARGSATFLSRTTGILAALFLLLSLGMGMYLAKTRQARTPDQGLGVMAGAAAQLAPASSAPALRAGEVPASNVPASDVPSASAPAATAQSDAASASQPATASTAGK